MRAALAAAFAILCALAAPPARALCIGCSCDVQADPIAFLPFNPLTNPQVDAAGEVRVSCTGLAGAFIDQEIRLGPSAHSLTFAREMAKPGGARLAYNLYLNAARTQIWTQTAPNTHVEDIGLGLLVFSYEVGVFARIAGASAAEPGVYSDTITVTLVY